MRDNIYQKILLLLVALSWSLEGCDDSFLEIVPEDAATTGIFWQTPADVQEALNGAYDAFRSGSFMGGQGQFLSELMADHVSERAALANGDWAAHYTRTTDIFLGTTTTFMRDGYRSISRANFVLQHMDQIPDLPASDATRIAAECKFIRAVAHFELVRIFAQPFGYSTNNSHLGIPLRTTFGKDILSRSTVKEVYDQILLDLTEAAASLPNDNGGYATALAAKGYLAKVYFQMNDFPNAFAQANDVLTNGAVEMDSSLSNRFSENGTSEAIFELISDGLFNNSGGWIRDNYRPNPGNNNVPNIHLSSYLYNLITADAADKRGQEWVELNESGAFPLYLSTKFELEEAMNVPLVHVTELKLIRAESAAETGSNLDLATADINDIRTRAGVAPITGGAASLLAAARGERELELVGEGNRLHELKRQAVHNLPSLNIRNALWDCAGLVAQFPSSELQGNLDFIPNEEGGCN
ncbi:MAG: RagB/SusD family nutrient uptake outer membrane protein [Bacteroidota bacterium]